MNIEEKIEKILDIVTEYSRGYDTDMAVNNAETPPDLEVRLLSQLFKEELEKGQIEILEAIKNK